MTHTDTYTYTHTEREGLLLLSGVREYFVLEEAQVGIEC